MVLRDIVREVIYVPNVRKGHQGVLEVILHKEKNTP